jgi:hypothetical protein
VHDRTGGEDAISDRGGLRRDLVDGERPVPHAPALDRHLFLERDGKSLERADVLAGGVALGGLGRRDEGRLLTLIGQGVHGRLDLDGPLLHGGEQFERRQFLGAHPRQRLGGAQFPGFGHAMNSKRSRWLATCSRMS